MKKLFNFDLKKVYFRIFFNVMLITEKYYIVAINRYRKLLSFQKS